VPVCTSTSRLPLASVPLGWEALASSSAPFKSCGVTPKPFIRPASISTRTTCPGPPMVLTSRVPLTRLSSSSTARPTCCSSKAERAGSRVHKVSATTGTSSMPFGLMIGSPTPNSGEIQSRWLWMVSYRRRMASWLGTPTLNCTVITAMPGRDTEYT
jgi:hypothetical protein